MPTDKPTTQIFFKGLKFITTPQPTNREIIYKSYLDYRRKMNLRYFFRDSNINNQFFHTLKLKSSFEPPLPDNENVLEHITQVYREIRITSHIQATITKIYSSEQISAINNLQKNNNFTVKPGDKGGAIVLWPRDDYVREASKQLTNTTHYSNLLTNTISGLITNRRKFVLHYYQLGLFDCTTFKFLQPPTPTNTPTLYPQPEIHKSGNPGSLIIFGCDGPTVRLSKYTDHFLKPLVSNISSYVKDSPDFLSLLFKYNHNLPTNIILLTIDVKSLYTNIPHVEGIKAAIDYLNEFNSEINTDFLREF